MIDLLSGIFWLGNYLQKQFQWLECYWMTPYSTVRLAGSDSDYAVNTSEVFTEVSVPTQYILMEALMFMESTISFFNT